MRLVGVWDSCWLFAHSTSNLWYINCTWCVSIIVHFNNKKINFRNCSLHVGLRTEEVYFLRHLHSQLFCKEYGQLWTWLSHMQTNKRQSLIPTFFFQWQRICFYEIQSSTCLYSVAISVWTVIALMKQSGAQIPVFLACVLQDTEHLKYYTQIQRQNAFLCYFLNSEK